ncbi:MAG: hypothetical protein Q9M27_06400 [Mariprofundaceae bacterium]|nr:hypothetical protein [Mariprofundaceae bacterium]
MNINKVEQISKAFSDLLTEEIGLMNMDSVIIENSEPDADPATCASHSYCDSNMVMLAAYESIMGTVADFQEDAVVDYWNAAWSMAKKNDFYFLP